MTEVSSDIEHAPMPAIVDRARSRVWRRDGRPTALWAHLAAGRSDDLSQTPGR